MLFAETEMTDDLIILVTLAAILILPVVFVWTLKREDQARIAAGRNRIVMVGYQTKLGWITAVGLVALTWFLLTRP